MKTIVMFIGAVIATSAPLIANTAGSEKPCKRFRTIVLDPTYEHDKWGTEPKDHMYEFAAYISSFDSKDDNDGNGTEDTWGIPERVSYEIKKVTVTHKLTF